MNAETIPGRSCQTCPACGFQNGEGEHRCEKCGRRLDSAPGRDSPASESAAAKLRLVTSSESPPKTGAGPGSPKAPPRRPAFPEPLRRHLSAQVQQFRYRRLHPRLPFELPQEPSGDEGVIPIAPSCVSVRRPAPATPGGRPKPAPVTPEMQPLLEFPVPPARAKRSAPVVAPFRLRVLGHGMDLTLILAALLVFTAPFRVLASGVVVNRFLLAGGLGAALALALLYGVIFLWLAGATPGMRLFGLRLVNFDGAPASPPERLWRLLGVVASAGSFLLGFLWAAVDEERFSWHDRISKTFLSASRQ